MQRCPLFFSPGKGGPGLGGASKPATGNEYGMLCMGLLITSCSTYQKIRRSLRIIGEAKRLSAAHSDRPWTGKSGRMKEAVQLRRCIYKRKSSIRKKWNSLRISGIFDRSLSEKVMSCD